MYVELASIDARADSDDPAHVENVLVCNGKGRPGTTPSRAVPSCVHSVRRLLATFSMFLYLNEDKPFIYRPVGRTGPVWASRLFAVPTVGTLWSRAWRRDPRWLGKARETWSTADQPGWVWSGSTCTGTSLHLEEERRWFILRDKYWLCFQCLHLDSFPALRLYCSCLVRRTQRDKQWNIPKDRKEAKNLCRVSVFMLIYVTGRFIQEHWWRTYKRLYV